MFSNCPWLHHLFITHGRPPVSWHHPKSSPARPIKILQKLYPDPVLKNYQNLNYQDPPELPTTKNPLEFVNSPPKLSRFKNPRELCGNYPNSRWEHKKVMPQIYQNPAGGIIKIPWELLYQYSARTTINTKTRSCRNYQDPPRTIKIMWELSKSHEKFQDTTETAKMCEKY